MRGTAARLASPCASPVDRHAKRRHAGCGASKPLAPRVRARPGFFYKSYERPYYYFEAIDMIRKFLLVGGLALLEQGTPVQLMLAQLICLIFLCMILLTSPYKKADVDFTNQASLVTTSVGGRTA